LIFIFIDLFATREEPTASGLAISNQQVTCFQSSIRATNNLHAAVARGERAWKAARSWQSLIEQ
jgi:hypothetical protein